MFCPNDAGHRIEIHMIKCLLELQVPPITLSDSKIQSLAFGCISR